MFKSKKEWDLIHVVEVNSDIFTIESRVADFIGLEDFGRGVRFKDEGREVRASFFEDQSVCHRVSHNLLSDIYYFSDMEHFELFIKDLDLKVDKFKDSINEVLKSMWEEIDEKSNI